MAVSKQINGYLQDSGIDLFITYPCAKIRRLLALVKKDFFTVSVTKEEEGVGICAGVALAGKKPGMLIQSTGLGNMINALCSLTLTYQLPLLILASWRGVYEEEISAQIPLGKRLPQILQATGLGCHIIDAESDLSLISDIAEESYATNSPQVILLSPQLWVNEPSLQEPEISAIDIVTKKIKSSKSLKRQFTRYEILQQVHPFLDKKLVISNIGFPSRELYEVHHQPSNFYMLGSLGLASSIGLGVAMFTSRQVMVIDGDGSLLANLGTLATIAQVAPENLTILAIDNGVHGSTGNQPTPTSTNVDLSLSARALGIQNVFSTGDRDELTKIISSLSGGPNFVHIAASPGNQSTKSIPLSPVQIKNSFQKEMRSDQRKVPV
ncbi:MAG: sulfopyruvate decarboxylase subunit alpha [Candidatus Hodarchaeota archaeon]